LAQQPQTAPKKEKATWRTVGVVAGAGGGYVLGLVIGLDKFDDAINSDRKVWTAAIVGAVAGAVGGYFIGRAVDKHNATAWNLDPMDRSLVRAQHVEWSAAGGRADKAASRAFFPERVGLVP